MSGAYKITGSEWNKVSAESKDLLQRMLEIDPNKRISVILSVHKTTVTIYIVKNNRQ